MDAKALNGMAIVSLEEGTKLGAIEQPLFDMATRQLGALEVAGDAGRFVVPFDQIRQIRSNAVTVTSSQVTQAPSTGNALGALLRLHDLEKLKIVDEQGTLWYDPWRGPGSDDRADRTIDGPQRRPARHRWHEHTD